MGQELGGEEGIPVRHWVCVCGIPITHFHFCLQINSWLRKTSAFRFKVWFSWFALGLFHLILLYNLLCARHYYEHL